jgi:hypothetical protein
MNRQQTLDGSGTASRSPVSRTCLQCRRRKVSLPDTSPTCTYLTINGRFGVMGPQRIQKSVQDAPGWTLNVPLPPICVAYDLQGVLVKIHHPQQETCLLLRA